MVLLTEVAPNNFRNVNIYPTEEEILGVRSFFRKNIIEGSYTNVEEYLDIQFRLLREDFVANVREAIENYQSKEATRSIEIYKNVRIYQDKTSKNEGCLKINILEEREDSKKFMIGSLLLFTKNNFNDLFLAKVVRKNPGLGEVSIELIDLHWNSVNFCQDYTMAECSQYFDPYFQVLNALKNISVENFPMEKYIVHVDTSSIYMPKYLLYSGSKYEIDGYNISPEDLPKISHNLLGLNDAQFTAFKAALTQEFVVIQGPPGTGKTHLGVTIASTLLKNSHFWYLNTPMLVISHKNDALDKFLEGLVPITDKLVRVGGQSKSEKLRDYNLTNDKTGKKRPKEDYLNGMRKALVVGMTTTIAARWKDYLERLKPPIVIVEEAAEVLEAHVVAALTNSCQHLILLGDHQQLQPIPADYNIGKNFYLGMSLFERMVTNKVQHYQLDVQHRMRPEISNLLKVKIYPFLKDHKSVLERPHILGVEKDVFFINHHNPEEPCNVTTKKNPFEARFLVSFARYLVLNGYQSQDIVILATYAGQLQEIGSLVPREKCLEGIKLSTLDGFQGQESEIVLLSLVRNEEIGFLGKPNRVCVALSRAKTGFYIMGNMDLLSKNSLWSSVKRSLQHQKAIGSQLVLKCQNHQNLTKIESLDDFWLVQNGGCRKKCGCMLSCGHICCLLCHSTVMNHKCERGCLQSVILNENQIKFSNLWRKPRPDSYQEVGNQVQETSFFGSIFTTIGRMIANFIHYVIDSFT